MKTGMAMMTAAILCTTAQAQAPVPKVECGTPPLNLNRAAVMKFYEENIYGVRQDMKDFQSKIKVVSSEELPELNGIRKVVEINTMTPIGESTFHAYAYFPRREGKAPTFVCIRKGNKQVPPDTDDPKGGDILPVIELLRRGYAGVDFGCEEAFPDGDGPFKNLTRAPNAWGTLSTWALACSRVMDYLETEPLADNEKVAIVGLSRRGKTALWAGATDTRFAMVVPVGSGCFGARALTRNVNGETIERILKSFPFGSRRIARSSSARTSRCPLISIGSWRRSPRGSWWCAPARTTGGLVRAGRWPAGNFPVRLGKTRRAPTTGFAAAGISCFSRTGLTSWTSPHPMVGNDLRGFMGILR